MQPNRTFWTMRGGVEPQLTTVLAREKEESNFDERSGQRTVEPLVVACHLSFLWMS